MIEKRYLDANQYLADTFRLARLVLDSGWKPDVLLALWRGGAPVGVAVHEFLCYHHWQMRHFAVKCASYTGIGERQQVVFDHADDVFGSIVPGTRVLVVDDVFDTGGTAQAVADRLKEQGAEMRFAAVYWKPHANASHMKPDYIAAETDAWIVFPHEMEGLTYDEIRVKNPALYALLR